MHSKLTFTDGVNGIYIAPLQEAVYKKIPAFFKEVLEEAEYTVRTNTRPYSPLSLSLDRRRKH